MKKDGFSEILDIMRDLDVNQEFKEFLGNEKQLKEIVAKESEDVQKTLQHLSTYGSLKGITDKVKNLMRKAKEGRVSYDQLKESLQKAAKITTDEVLEVYQIAHQLFSERKYEEARAIATFLSYLNPEISAFWRMCGSCYWNLGNEKAALGPFIYASMCNALEVENHLSALDCLIKLGFTQEALNYCATAREVLTEASQWDDIKKIDAKAARI